MTMGSGAEWAMVIVTGVSAYFIWRQLRASHEELRADHERSRRELAVTLVQDWTKGQKLESSAVAALVADLSLEQCAKLAARTPFSLKDDKSNREAVKRCLEFKYDTLNIEGIIKDGWINLSGDHVMFIRFHAVYYLNLIESILLAWNKCVADESTLEGQFSFLLHSGTDLGTFRNAAKHYVGGIDLYPSISNFLEKISPPVTGKSAPIVR